MNILSEIIASGVAAAAAGAVAKGAVSPSSELFGPVVWRTSSPSRIALTFDDGPNPTVTPQLVDLLGRHSVRASFFVIGQFVRACPELVKDMADRGHVIANHTETHANLCFHLPAGIRDELARCQESIVAATHAEPPQWMRPPWGYRNPLLYGEIRRAGIRGVVQWSKTCYDWKPQTTAQLIEVLSNVARRDPARGDIVLMHDGDHRVLNGDRGHIIAALEHWLPRWRDAGMEFVTMNAPEFARTSGSRGPRA